MTPLIQRAKFGVIIPVCGEVDMKRIIRGHNGGLTKSYFDSNNWFIGKINLNFGKIAKWFKFSHSVQEIFSQCTKMVSILGEIH
jgi:hypothetical protein